MERSSAHAHSLAEAQRTDRPCRLGCSSPPRSASGFGWRQYTTRLLNSFALRQRRCCQHVVLRDWVLFGMSGAIQLDCRIASLGPFLRVRDLAPPLVVHKRLDRTTLRRSGQCNTSQGRRVLPSDMWRWVFVRPYRARRCRRRDRPCAEECQHHPHPFHGTNSELALTARPVQASTGRHESHPRQSCSRPPPGPAH